MCVGRSAGTVFVSFYARARVKKRELTRCSIDGAAAPV
jgi:hypothetical protein